VPQITDVVFNRSFSVKNQRLVDMMNYKQGFTLVELMIGVAILGILAAVAMPSYQQFIRDSEFNDCAKYLLASRLTATNLIVSNNSSVVGIDAAALGLANGNECGSIAVTVPTASEVLTISGVAGGKTFQMQRDDVAGGGVWSCSVDAVAVTSCSDLQ
jgi:type IV pilus assembly protein PilA